MRYLFLIVFLMIGCKPHKSEIKELKGEVFGSYYLVKYVGELETSVLQKSLNAFFKKFNDEFSTYQNDSLITKFNKASAHKKLKVSTEFIELLEIAQKLHQDTKGAFDPTLAPVIKAWGFGGGKKRSSSPRDSEIKEILKLVGFHHIKWDKEKLEIWKTKDKVVLDVNAFAPGLAADLIGRDLEAKGVHHFMIDISGEFLVKGEKAQGTPWVIGIEKPIQENKTIQRALTLRDEALATSGNYRQFFNDQGIRRSHIIDPRTGIPVTHQIASATVIASSAALADGWGTAMMVLGEEGVALAQKANIKVMLLKAKSETEFEEIISTEFKKYLLPKR